MRDLAQINAASTKELTHFLSGLYEHSDWIVEQAFTQRPFADVAALHRALHQVVRQAPREAQMALIRQHPMLTGKAKIDTSLAPDSQSEQSLIGLDRCSEAEFKALNELNLAYLERFGWPFIIAVKGPMGTGLTREQIIENLKVRLKSPPALEFEECLDQIHQIAQWRLKDRMGITDHRSQSR
jgi:N-carbamoyl-L-amino-acid hydrolase